MADKPLVEVKFNFEGTDTHSIATSNSNSKPYDPNLIAEDARESNLSFNYSGRHDHGKLPDLKSDGIHNEIVASLIQAKEETGTYLTTLISNNNNNLQSESKNKNDGESEPKKPRTS